MKNSRIVIRSLLIAIPLALITQWLVCDVYTVPSQSMEETLLKGDYILVSKIQYGALTPETILRLPFANASLFGFPTYSNVLHLPPLRLYGTSSIRNFDVVVFRDPTAVDLPADIRPHLVKRCVGIAGDTIEIKRSTVFVNGKEEPSDPNVKQRCWLIGTKYSERNLDSLNISDYNAFMETFNDSIISNDISGYEFSLENSRIAKLKDENYPIVRFSKDSAERDMNLKVFPHSILFSWNADWLGPLRVPFKGMSIELNERTIDLYRGVIFDHEENEGVSLVDGHLWINRKNITSYTFKKDYYFMIGDNRSNSVDSRFIGFVPADHIDGKVVRVIRLKSN